MEPERAELALRINSMLSALHFDDSDAFSEILDSSEADLLDLLIGGLVTIKGMLDTVLETIEEEAGVSFDFSDLIMAATEYVIESESDEGVDTTD